MSFMNSQRNASTVVKAQNLAVDVRAFVQAADRLELSKVHCKNLQSRVQPSYVIRE